MLKGWRQKSINLFSGRKWRDYLLVGVLMLVMVIGAGCRTEQIAAYDPVAFDNNVGLKNRTVELMKHAAKEYSELQIAVLQEFSVLQSEMEALKGYPVLYDLTLNQPGLQAEMLHAYRADREKLKNDLRTTVEAERFRDKNELTVLMWEILTDPHRDLLGGFLEKWDKDTALLEDYLQKKQNLSDRKLMGNLELLADALKKWLEGKHLTKTKIEEIMGREDNPAEGTVIWAFNQLIEWEKYKKPEYDKKEREELLNKLRQWVDAQQI